jgi:GT2 family glycosyltransferase
MKHRELIHRLNQRYFQEWQRAELLAQQLAGRSLWARVRHWWRRKQTRLPAGERVLAPGDVPPGLVSVIVPFRDQYSLLRACLRSLRGSARVSEIILVDNGSQHPRMRQYLQRTRHTVVSLPEPFNFSRLCNAGAGVASGEWLLFLNNDTEALHPDWIEQMLRLAVHPDVGPVGATLVYPDGSIQHAGLHPDSAGRWVHVHRHQPAHAPALAHSRTVPAVSAACLLIHREKWDRLGGFNECLPVTYNDVDFCLRARQNGWKTAICAQARLIHYEGLTRGFSGDSPGSAHLAHLAAFPTGAGAWPESISNVSDSPSASEKKKAD